MSTIYLNIGLVLALASILAIFSQKIKQPLLVGYIVAGVLVGTLGVFHGEGNSQVLELLAAFGTTFLLFLVGLELRFSDIRTYGPLALFLGAGQVIATTLVGLLLNKLLGFSFSESLYLAIGLTFSSTIVVIKLLTDRRDLDSLYGKLTVGFLLVQDALAILALILVSTLGSSGGSFGSLFLVLVKSVFLVSLVIICSKTLLIWMFNQAGRSIEVLFITSIAWAVLVSTLALGMGLSVEIGAFLAGVALANLPQESQIAARVKPLRDLFVVFFFVVLGAGLTLSNIFSLILPILILSVFVLVGKPLIMLVVTGALGLRKRTAFMTSIGIAQVSEFSLILLTLGKANGSLDPKIVDMMTAVTLITILGSSYLVMHSTSIYKKFAKQLSVFEKKEKIEEINDDTKEYKDHVILIGAGRLGWEVLKQLQKQNKEVLVVEFNPSIVAVLKEKDINYLFGDITDPEIFDQARVENAELIISTVFDPDDSEELLESLKSLTKKPLVFVTGSDHESAMRFYKQGADYVIIPRVLSGHQVASFLTSEKLKDFREGVTREEHMRELREIANRFG